MLATRIAIRGRDQDAATSDAPFRFGQFREINADNSHSVSLQPSQSSRKTGWIDHRIADPKRIGGKRFVRIDVDDFSRSEAGRIDPTTIGKKNAVCHGSNRRLQVQTIANRYATNSVVERPEQASKLTNSFHIGSCRLADKGLAAEANHVAAIERSRRFDETEGPKLSESACHGIDFRSPRFGAGARDDSDFIQNNSGILDEDGIGLIGQFGESANLAAKPGEHLLELVVLPPGEFHIDRVTTQMRQFAAVDTRADIANEGDHGIAHLP